MNDILRNAIAAAATAAPVTPQPTEPDVQAVAPPPAAEQVSDADGIIKGLDEKAVLVSVKRRMYSPYALDAEESERYGAGNVNKHLFKGRDNRVKQAISKYTEVYTYIKSHTVPWSTGVDMLNINLYQEVTHNLRRLIAEANAAVDDLVDNWDYEVQRDYNRLLPTGHASLEDYPTAEHVRDRFGIEVQFMPVPTTGDFRVEISDEDKASLLSRLQDAGRNAERHVINKMLEPMIAAAEKLAVPIGSDGSIFRDSLVENLVDVADRMARVNLSDDPVIQKQIADLKSIVGQYADNIDVLRNSQHVRDVASKQISDLIGQMKGVV